MTQRTLVIGIPLPHVSFDNYSFASAPSISEYTRLIVEMQSVSAVVQEIIDSAGQHNAFDGRPVVNTRPGVRSFGLAGLLAMRMREATQFFNRGGACLCIAYPDALHEGIEGLGSWRLFEWLPPAEGLDYASDLLPGFGKEATDVCAPDHPFAPYIAAYGARMRYRAHAPAGCPAIQTFALSAGGLPVGFEVSVMRGRIVFVPPFDIKGEDRGAIAGTLFECFERLQARFPDRPPEWIRKEAL